MSVRHGYRRRTPRPYPESVYSAPPSIQQGLVDLSSRLSMFNHTFVSSISTRDVVNLLTARYAAASDQTNKKHRELTEEIFALMRGYRTQSLNRSESDQLNIATHTIERIDKSVVGYHDLNEKILKPFTTLSKVVQRIFSNHGIQVADNIILGNTDSFISSEMLSSGEKQMLSFLCYNAFSSDVPILIDEPELSLHVDWQRILFPTLLAQGTNNQFLIATHSPFIYSQYSDKELVLGTEK
jgi:predicted ATPase